MAGWEFELTGANLDLELLASLFDGGQVRVIRHDDNFWLRADNIAATADADDARLAGAALLRTINGVAVLTSSGTGRASLGSMVHTDAVGKTSTVLTPGPAKVTLRTMPPKVLINGVAAPSKEQRFVDAALSSADIEHVLRIYGSRELDWRDLYVILDVIEEDVGGETALANKGWAPPADLKRFTHTANSRRAIGDRARHGRNWDAPKDPMNLGDARRLIDHLVDRWLGEKIS